MRFYQNNCNPVLSPLIATPEDFRDFGFIREVKAADMVIALSRHDHDMDIIWGHDVPERLIKGEMGTPNIVYIAIDFKDTDELVNVINAVRMLKEGVGDDHGQQWLSMDAGSQ